MIDTITAKDIRAAFVELIQGKAQIPYEIHFNHVNKSTASYVWVEFQMKKSSWDAALFQRSIDVDIHVILNPDDYAVVKYTGLWDISDSLTKAIMPCVQIKDRFITVYEFNSHIVDDVLHYEFNLDFTDYVQSDEYEGVGYELMQELSLNLRD